MKNFFKTIVIYFIGNVASRLMSFLLIPLYTEKIKDTEMGYYDLAFTIVTIICSVISIEIWIGILRYMYDYKKISEKRRVISTGLVIVFLSLLVFTAGFWTSFAFFKFKYGIMIYVAGISFILYQALAYVTRGYGEDSVYVSSGVIGTLIAVITNVILIVRFRWQGDALLLASAFSYLIPAVYIEYRMGIFRRFKFRYVDKDLLRTIFAYCLPLSLNSIAYWVNFNFGRIVINSKLGIDMVGQYAVAMKFTTIVMLIVTVFNMAWQEATYSMAKNENRSLVYSRVFKYYSRFIGCGILLLVPVTSIIFPIMVHSDYGTAKYIIPIAYLATFASTLSSFLGNISCAEKNTKSTLASNVFGSVVSVVSIYPLIGILGIQAASVSLFLGFFAVTSMRIINIRKNLKLKVDVRFFMIYTIIFILTSAVYFLLPVSANIIIIVPLLIFTLFVLRELIIDILKRVISFRKSKSC